MNILALETSGMAGSVAALQGQQVLAERELDPSARTARTLVPALGELLRETGWTPSDVQLLVVTSGPGSFTGLRIGVTTAKTFSYATGAALLGVNTLAAIACQAACSADQLWVVLDAERDQLFAGLFRRAAAGWVVEQPTRIVDRLAWLADLRRSTDSLDGDRASPPATVAVSGPGLSRLAGVIPSGVQIVPESRWAPRASAVGVQGWRDFTAGHRSDCWTLVPQYFRASAAEEQADRPAPS